MIVIIIYNNSFLLLFYAVCIYTIPVISKYIHIVMNY